MRGAVILAAVLTATTAAAQAVRDSRDPEMRQAARIYSSDGTASERFAAAINLGDLHATSGNRSEALIWWRRAERIAAIEMTSLREAGRVAAWARFAAWRATAAAALGNRGASVDLFEQARRVLPGDVGILAQYASAELTSGASRQAAELALAALAHPIDDPLDHAALQYTLARAQIRSGSSAEARETLEGMIATLEGEQTAATRKSVARTEEFTTFGLSSGDAQAWTSLRSRGETLLAELLIADGESEDALIHARAALAVRSDYAPALAIIALHERSPAAWSAAFSSDPFDRDLHRSYTDFLRHGGARSGDAATVSPVQRVIELTHDRRWSAAASLLRELKSAHPQNESLLALEAELLLGQGRSADARAIIESIASESMRASIDSSPVISASASVPPTGTLLENDDLAMIGSRLIDPATAVATAAALNERTYSAKATLASAALDGDTTSAAGAVTAAGTALRFPSITRFTGDLMNRELVLEFTILAADAEGLVVQPSGAQPQ